MNTIKQTLDRNTELAKLLYKDFEMRITGKGPLEGLKEKVHSCEDPVDVQLLSTFRKFNQSINKTNFYKEVIGAVGFRLDP